LPPENKNNPAEMRSAQEYILNRMQRMITQTFTKTTTAAERDAYFEEELKACEVEQEVRVGHELNRALSAFWICSSRFFQSNFYLIIPQLLQNEINLLTMNCVLETRGLFFDAL
jgi:hypothetical protein